MDIECEEQPQTTSVPYPNQVVHAGKLCSLRTDVDPTHVYTFLQEYIDDLGCLLKAATHPRSTALLQKALEEAKREGLPNGDKDRGGSEGSKEVATAAISSHAAPVVKSGRTVPLVYSTRISQYGEKIST